MSEGGERGALHVVALTKRYPGAPGPPALQGVEAQWPLGSVVGLFGRNGAGKTTLLRIAAGLLAPDTGGIGCSVRATDRPRALSAREIGWCPAEDRTFYPRLSARENLLLFGTLVGLSRAECAAAVERADADLGLAPFLERAFQACSAGQRQRLNLARAILHEPRVLLLDEPLRSLDPSGERAVARILQRWRARSGAIAIWSAHELFGLEQRCDHVALLDGGRLVESGPRDHVLGFGTAQRWRGRARGEAERAVLLARSGARELPGSRNLAWPAVGGALPPELARELAGAEHGIEELTLERHRGIEEWLAQRAGPAGANAAAPARPSAALKAIDAAPRSALRPFAALASTARALRALARRDRLVYLSRRAQIALQLFVVLMWAAALQGIARLVDGDARADALIGGAGFLSFALLGLAALHVANVAQVGTGQALREEQFQRTLEPLVATGRAPLLLLLGALAWPLLCETVAVGAMLLAAHLWFGLGFAASGWCLALPAAVLTLLALTMLGVLSASFSLAFQRGDPVAAALHIASTVVGGVYFPTTFLPDWLAAAGEFLPLTWGLRVVRGALLEGRGLEDGGQRTALAVLAAMCALLLVVSPRTYARAYAFARRRGTLSHT